MDIFAKIVNDIHSLTTFAKSCMLDICISSGYASAHFPLDQLLSVLYQESKPSPNKTFYDSIIFAPPTKVLGVKLSTHTSTFLD